MYTSTKSQYCATLYLLVNLTDIVALTAMRYKFSSMHKKLFQWGTTTIIAGNWKFKNLQWGKQIRFDRQIDSTWH